MALPQVVLFQWRSDWGLASIDPQCLAAQACLRMHGVRFKTVSCDNPQMSPSGVLPLLLVESNTLIDSIQGVYQYAASHGRVPALELSDEQKFDTDAAMTLVAEQILPALLHSAFREPQNYEALTSKAYEKGRVWPLSWLLSYKIRSNVAAALQERLGDATSKEIYQNAADACAALDDWLDAQTYFFGERPSLLDAVVYGHLAPVLNCPYPNDDLQRAIVAYPRLANFVGRIKDEYFAPSRAVSMSKLPQPAIQF